ncbi:hypothetical protein RCIP0023_00287 [Klebsiella phage RCIP0023]|nr:hypothetical protein CPT_Muenster_062 [Klebsiella phage Muenster]
MNSPNGRASISQLYLYNLKLSYIIKSIKTQNNFIGLPNYVREMEIDSFVKDMIEIYKIQGKLPPFDAL